MHLRAGMIVRAAHSISLDDKTVIPLETTGMVEEAKGKTPDEVLVGWEMKEEETRRPITISARVKTKHLTPVH